MLPNWNSTFKSVRRKVKSNRKYYLHLFLAFLFVVIYFYFSNNIVVDENTWAVSIVKTKKVETKHFSKIYSWKVESSKTLDFDIDLTDVYLTWAIVDIEFSNNKNFELYPVWSNKNLDKIRYWYMLWKARNKGKVFWVWKVTESVKKNRYNVLDDIEDGRLYFRAANLEWWDLFVRLNLKWEKIINK